MSKHDNGVPDTSAPETNSSGDPGAPPPELPRWATKAARSTPFSDERMAAYIGPRWEATYRAKLAGFVADPAFTPTWNWAAAIFGPLWFLYRKLYLAFAALYIIPMIALPLLVTADTQQMTMEWLRSPAGKPAFMVLGALGLSMRIAAGGTANWLLFRRARAASMVVTLQQVPEEVAISRLQRLGGVSRLPALLYVLLSLAFTAAAALAPAP